MSFRILHWGGKREVIALVHQLSLFVVVDRAWPKVRTLDDKQRVIFWSLEPIKVRALLASKVHRLFLFIHVWVGPCKRSPLPPTALFSRVAYRLKMELAISLETHPIQDGYVF